MAANPPSVNPKQENQDRMWKNYAIITEPVQWGVGPPHKTPRQQRVQGRSLRDSGGTGTERLPAEQITSSIGLEPMGLVLQTVQQQCPFTSD